MYLSNKAEHSPGLVPVARVAGCQGPGNEVTHSEPTRQPRTGRSEPRALRHDGRGAEKWAKETRHLHTRTPVPATLPKKMGTRHGVAKESSSRPSCGGRRERSPHGPRSRAAPPGPPQASLANMVSETRGQRQHTPRLTAQGQINMGTRHTTSPPPGRENQSKDPGGGPSLAPPRPDRDPVAGQGVWCLQTRWSRSSRTSVLGSGTFPPHVVYGPPRWAWGSLLSCTQGRGGCGIRFNLLLLKRV